MPPTTYLIMHRTFKVHSTLAPVKINHKMVRSLLTGWRTIISFPANLCGVSLIVCSIHFRLIERIFKMNACNAWKMCRHTNLVCLTDYSTPQNMMSINFLCYFQG